MRTSCTSTVSDDRSRDSRRRASARCSTRSSRHGMTGTGLGLTIVHRIIDEHDGHIEVGSGPDGTTFRVSLPIAAPTDDVEER